MNDESRLGFQLIAELPISSMDAYLLLRELLEVSKGRGDKVRRAQKCIRLGGTQLEAKSASFEHVVKASLEARKHRSPRTIREIRIVTNRLMRCCPEFKKRQVRDISGEDCRKWLDKCFSSPRQWAKGRVILSGVLTYAVKQGWCDRNEVLRLSPKLR